MILYSSRMHSVIESSIHNTIFRSYFFKKELPKQGSVFLIFLRASVCSRIPKPLKVSSAQCCVSQSIRNLTHHVYFILLLSSKYFHKSILMDFLILRQSISFLSVALLSTDPKCKERMWWHKI